MDAKEARERTDEIIASQRAEAERVHTSRMREVEKNRKIALNSALNKIKHSAEQGSSSVYISNEVTPFGRRRGELLTKDLKNLGYGVSRHRSGITITW